MSGRGLTNRGVGVVAGVTARVEDSCFGCGCGSGSGSGCCGSGFGWDSG